MNARTIEKLVIGSAMAGGFLGGFCFIGAEPRAIIVSPRAEGEITAIRWHKNLKGIKGATSYCDGLANTRDMAAAGSPLAEKMLALRIGGFDDWHLMARAPALIIHGELCALPEFQDGTENGFSRKAYWTSTRHADNTGYAWSQYFGHGNQYYSYHSYELCARAVRTIPV